MTANWTEQMNHEATKSYYDWLVKIVYAFAASATDQITALEVGAAWGVSTRAILENHKVAHLTSVDVLDCPLAVGEVQEIGAESRWSFVRGNSAELLPRFKQQGKRYDFVFIDGDHRQDRANKDMVDGYDLLNPGGIMVMDDVLHRNNFSDTHKDSFGVARALWGLMIANQLPAELYPSWTTFGLVRKPR